MAQQINLFNPIFLKQKRYFSATAMAQAGGLIVLGVQHEDRVAVASTTRLEWALADLAIMCSGTATSTVYPTTIASEVAFIIADSGSRVVFAEDDTQVAKVRVASAGRLADYYDAVHDQTLTALRGLAARDLERIVDERWDPPVSLGVRLVSVLSDDLQHAGQAAYVRGLRESRYAGPE